MTRYPASPQAYWTLTVGTPVWLNPAGRVAKARRPGWKLVGKVAAIGKFPTIEVTPL